MVAPVFYMSIFHRSRYPFLFFYLDRSNFAHIGFPFDESHGEINKTII